MLGKLFGIRAVRPRPPFERQAPPRPASVAAGQKPSALKIIHAGGAVEYYYMAVPAARILEKYPSFILARPDVFQRPWDAVVRPEEILIPGQKYFIVPRRTLKKLRGRIRKPNGESHSHSFVSQLSGDFQLRHWNPTGESHARSYVSRPSANFQRSWKPTTGSHAHSFVSQPTAESDLHSKSFHQESNANIDAAETQSRRRVRFAGVETEPGSNDNQGKSLNSKAGGSKKTVAKAVTWRPKLAVITESRGCNNRSSLL